MPLVPTQGTEKMLLTWIQCCNRCRFAVDSTMKGQLWKVARRATDIRYERLLIGREVALFVDVRCRISGNDPLRWGGRSTGRKIESSPLSRSSVRVDLVPNRRAPLGLRGGRTFHLGSSAPAFRPRRSPKVWL